MRTFLFERRHTQGPLTGSRDGRLGVRIYTRRNAVEESKSDLSAPGDARNVEIEILFFAGCPNSEAALERAREAVAIEGVAANVQMIEILDTQHAIARRFLGSPTIHIDGEDVEPEARMSGEFGFACRTYRASDGSVAGAPSVDLIAIAIDRRRSATSLS